MRRNSCGRDRRQAGLKYADGQVDGNELAGLVLIRCLDEYPWLGRADSAKHWVRPGYTVSAHFRDDGADDAGYYFYDGTTAFTREQSSEKKMKCYLLLIILTGNMMSERRQASLRCDVVGGHFCRVAHE